MLHRDFPAFASLSFLLSVCEKVQRCTKCFRSLGLQWSRLEWWTTSDVQEASQWRADLPLYGPLQRGSFLFFFSFLLKRRIPLMIPRWGNLHNYSRFYRRSRFILVKEVCSNNKICHYKQQDIYKASWHLELTYLKTILCCTFNSWKKMKKTCHGTEWKPGWPQSLRSHSSLVHLFTGVLHTHLLTPGQLVIFLGSIKWHKSQQTKCMTTKTVQKCRVEHGKRNENTLSKLIFLNMGPFTGGGHLPGEAVVIFGSGYAL